MAPEFYDNKPYDGVKSDIFATGVALFIMVTETLPFDNTQKNDQNILYDYLRD